ncbi:MAG: glycosyltransferase family 39 protein, partial [Dehalococcoidia bacterium]
MIGRAPHDTAPPGGAERGGATWLLIAAGANLAALYALMSTRMPLARYFPGEGVTVAFPGMLGPNWQRNAALYVVVVVAAFAWFALAVAVVWRRRAMSRRLLLGFTVVFFLALFWMYPPTSMDLFHYQADARTMWVYGQNPLVVAPSANSYPIAIVWAEQPSPYGPLWSLLTFFATAPFGEGYLASLYAFKALVAVFFAGCLWLIYRIARDVRPGWEWVAVVLFAWNPFVVIRTFGNGSNDLVMMFFALLALERLRRRDWLVAFWALAASLLVKYVTAVLVPLALLYAWRHIEGDVFRRARSLLPGTIAGILMVVVCYLPFWDGRATLETLQRQANNHMVTSIPTLVWVRLLPLMSPDDATAVSLRLTRALYLALYLPLLWQARRDFGRL